MRARPSKWKRNACTPHLGHWKGQPLHKWDRKKKISQNFDKVLKAKSELVYQFGIVAGPDTRVHSTPFITNYFIRPLLVPMRKTEGRRETKENPSGWDRRVQNGQ